MFHKNLRVNPERFRANFESLARIGATTEGGINRETFSPAHTQAREWFRELALINNLDFSIDNAGNHSAILNCGGSDAPRLLLGSHLDSVPNAGVFDGALGVLAAFEVLQTVQDAQVNLPFNLEVIDFTDEEGTLVGLLGSSAIAGKLTTNDLLKPRGGRQKLINRLSITGLAEEDLLNAKRNPRSIIGYLELHIEQGERLFEAKKDIGIVSNIVGICSYQIYFKGRANHAGTTSMESRIDAAQGASAFCLEVRELVINDFPDCVANIGNMAFKPGAFNIIPECVIVSLEFRAPTKELLYNLESALLNLAKEQAKRFRLKMNAEYLGRHSPATMSNNVQDTLRKVAHVLGLKTLTISSGAGHDAYSLADICPTGMIFVPSVDGISHSPLEYTAWSDCVNGANMLLLTVLELASNH